MRPLRQSIWHSAGEDEVPSDPAWLAPAERERASSLRFTKRRNDYLLGRFAAKCAVARALGLGLDLQDLGRIEIRNRMDGPERGAPEVFVDGTPAPLDISLSDRSGWAVCMLSPAGVRAGCDLELVEERSAAFVADYLTSDEQDFVHAARSDRECWSRANLIWSAKESVLKVLRTGLRRDTRSVEIEVLGSAGPEGWHALRAQALGEGEFVGWWRRFGDFLLTVASDTPAAPPQELGHPTGLRAATPSESWMESPTVHS